MSLICFLQVTLGNLFVIRTVLVFRERGVLHQSIVTKTGTAAMAALAWTPLLSNHSPRFSTLAGAILAISPLLAFMLSEKRVLRELEGRFPVFVDRWILNLRLGNSAISARDVALREESEAFQALLRPLFQTRGDNRPRHLFLPFSVVNELEQICTTTHSALARLENLRQLLRRSAEFRHKSGSAVRQTAIQAVIMLVLLLALVIYTVHRYTWTRVGDLVATSTLLSLTGVALMVRLSQKTRWKL